MGPEARSTLILVRDSSDCQFALETLDKAFQFFAAARMTQLAERLRFDLPDALASHFEVLADFFQRMIRALADPKALAQDLFLARRERAERIIDLPLQIVA